jgi:hypothetical protein
MTWKCLSDQTWHWKKHVVSDDLVHAIEGELYDRAVAEGVTTCTFVIEDQIDDCFFDLPGMCLQVRAMRRLDLKGLRIEIPSEDFADILAEVRLLPERSVGAGTETLTYYKLHGWRYCIVLSTAERKLLVEAMEAQAVEAEAEAEVDRQRFVKALEGMPNVVSARAEAIKKANAGNAGAN